MVGVGFESIFYVVRLKKTFNSFFYVSAVGFPFELFHPASKAKLAGGET